MKFYLMIRIDNDNWRCLHSGTQSDCMNKGSELDDTYEWAIFQEVRYSSGRESFSI